MATGNGIFDGLATLGIGVLLVAIVVLLAIETKSLLLGESATPAEVAKIHSALLGTPGVDRIIHLHTMHLGPDELLVAAKIGVHGGGDAVEVSQAIDGAEARIRHTVPTAKTIYLEPDIYRTTPTGPG